MGISDWFKSFPLAVAALASGHVHLRHEHVGEELRMADGRTYIPFRYTLRDGETMHDPTVLNPRFHLRFMRPKNKWRYRLFRVVCIVTTPFFVGLAGFRSKLWMEDPATGDFAGLYQWDGERDAEAYAEGLSKVLRALSVGGSVTYTVEPHATVEDYLARYK